MILNMKNLKIEVLNVLYQQKDIILLNVLIPHLVKTTNNIIWILLEMKKDARTIWRKLLFNHFLELILLVWAIMMEWEFFPRIVIERNKVLYLHKNHFCLIWNSQGVSFKEAVEDIARSFEIVDDYITEENVNFHFKYQFIPKKLDSHLTNFIVYDLETFNTDWARLYNITFYLLSELAAKYNRDLPP